MTPGSHKIMRFDFLSYNAGNSDLVIGSPASRPDLFVWSAGHGHTICGTSMNSCFSTRMAGWRRSATSRPSARSISSVSGQTRAPTPRFANCNTDQGISSGWADVYSSGLPCQYIVIDSVSNGDYTLQSTTNAKHVVGEDCFGDNTEWTGLRIAGQRVSEMFRRGFRRTASASTAPICRWRSSAGAGRSSKAATG